MRAYRCSPTIDELPPAVVAANSIAHARERLARNLRAAGIAPKWALPHYIIQPARRHDERGAA